MLGVRRALFGGRQRAAARTIKDLPPYQIALWPDGWECLSDGGVLVRDTDAMAEARRWYALADRSRVCLSMERAMQVHHAFVPRSILSLNRLRFGSEQAASVAVQLVAGEWVKHRREQMLRMPGKALKERGLTWSGSHFGEHLSGERLHALFAELVTLCVAEGLIPNIDYQVRIRRDNGFGISGFRCIVESRVDRATREHLKDVLATGLVPWNRVVPRDHQPYPVIGLEIRQPT